MIENIPSPPKNRMCHKTGFEKSCRDLVDDGICDLWVNVKGNNPQNPLELVDQWGCAEKFGHLLQIAIIAQVRAAAAEVEQLKNELISRIDNSRRIAAPEAEPHQQKLEDQHGSDHDHRP